MPCTRAGAGLRAGAVAVEAGAALVPGVTTPAAAELPGAEDWPPPAGLARLIMRSADTGVGLALGASELGVCGVPCSGWVGAAGAAGTGAGRGAGTSEGVVAGAGSVTGLGAGAGAGAASVMRAARAAVALRLAATRSRTPWAQSPKLVW